MGWKDWPYWIKGGVIGLGIFIVMFLLSYIILMLGCMDRVIYLLSIKSGIMFPTPCLLVYFFFASYSIMPFVFIVIGAIIGLIVGKIKSKK